MYLKQTKRNGRVYLAIMQNYREGGKVRSRTVETIGYADEFADRYDDPVGHFKEQVARMNEQRREEGAPIQLSLKRDALIPLGGAGSVQMGSAIALGYLDLLGAGRFFAATKHGSDAGRAFELLVSARMLHAVPIHETWNSREKFPRPCDFPYADLYRALEGFARSAQSFVGHLNRRYVQVRGKRRLDNVRLVLSNYEFGWATEGVAGGPDELGAHANARLCLAIDGGGIPLSYRIVPRDMHVDRVMEVVSSVKEESGAERVTLVAAQLSEADAVAKRLVEQGDGFVLLQPAESLALETVAWIDDAREYEVTRNGAFRIKSRVGKHAGGLLDAPLKEIAFSSTSGAHAQAFCIVSSEVGSSDAAVFNIYRELWRVHEPFQVIAADFISMPHPVETRAHLEAHFLVCYTAFFALRVLREDMDWRFNAAQVADALLAMEGAYVAENWFVFNYRTAVTDAIQQAAGLEVGRRLLSRDDIRRIPSRISLN